MSHTNLRSVRADSGLTPVRARRVACDMAFLGVATRAGGGCPFKALGSGFSGWREVSHLGRERGLSGRRVVHRRYGDGDGGPFPAVPCSVLPLYLCISLFVCVCAPRARVCACLSIWLSGGLASWPGSCLFGRMREPAMSAGPVVPSLSSVCLSVCLSLCLCVCSWALYDGMLMLIWLGALRAAMDWNSWLHDARSSAGASRCAALCSARHCQPRNQRGV
jgi:hypothetical protein